MQSFLLLLVRNSSASTGDIASEDTEDLSAAVQDAEICLLKSGELTWVSCEVSVTPQRSERSTVSGCVEMQIAINQKPTFTDSSGSCSGKMQMFFLSW